MEPPYNQQLSHHNHSQILLQCDSPFRLIFASFGTKIARNSHNNEAKFSNMKIVFHPSRNESEKKTFAISFFWQKSQNTFSSKLKLLFLESIFLMTKNFLLLKRSRKLRKRRSRRWWRCWTLSTNMLVTFQSSRPTASVSFTISMEPIRL